MPVPINLVGRGPNEDSEKENNLQMDFSSLSSFVTHSEPKKTVTASNKDAEVLMEIWLKADKTKADKTDEDVFHIDGLKLSSQDIISLKSRGLITGGTDEVKFTGRGKTVITTMVLSENNGFLKNQKEKSYTEIMANMSKKGKPGYRIPKMGSSNSIRL